MGLSLFALLAILSGIAGEMLSVLRTKSRMGSWISEENFTTMIRLSYPYARCCNIYLSKSISDIEVLFNQFRRIYPYEYLVRVRIYSCQGYFLLSPTAEEIVKAMEKVPASISTTEILAIVDSHIEANSSIFNVSLYGNANANVVARSGIWTLSENYLEPRIFRKIDRYENMMHQTDYVNLNGRRLRVTTYYRPPASYLWRTENKTVDGRESTVFLANADEEKDGIEMKVFMELAQKMNFTYTIIEPPDNNRYGYKVNDTMWKGGMIEMLRKKQVDIAFGSIWITADNHQFVNLTEPFYQMFIHFLVPRPRPTTSFWALTRPFSVDVWILLIASLAINTLCMYGSAWIAPQYPRRFRSLVITFTELFGRLLGTWFPRNTMGVRLQIHLWHTASFVIVAAYSCSLAARLASSEFEERIDTTRQFMEANLTWGRVGLIPAFDVLFDLNDPYSGHLPAQFRFIKNHSDLHTHIAAGNYAIIGKVVGTIFFPEDYIANQDLKNYRVMRDMVGKYYAAFAVQPWLLRPVNTVMLSLRESGITFFHLRDVIRRRSSYNLREVLVEQDGNDGRARVLALTPLGAGFSVLLVGLFVSCIVFYAELSSVRGTGSIGEVLREISRKRKERVEVMEERVRNKKTEKWKGSGREVCGMRRVILVKPLDKNIPRISPKP